MALMTLNDLAIVIIAVVAFVNNCLELLGKAILLQNKFLKNTAAFIEVISMQSLPRFFLSEGLGH